MGEEVVAGEFWDLPRAIGYTTLTDTACRARRSEAAVKVAQGGSTGTLHNTP